MGAPDPTTPTTVAATDARLAEIRTLMDGWSTATFTSRGHLPAARSLLADAGLELLARIGALEAELAERTRLGDAMADVCEDHARAWGKPVDGRSLGSVARDWRAAGRRDVSP